MKTDNIKAAVIEARRFIRTAEACIEARKATYEMGGHTYPVSTPKESGATRRASMDLTRALADMRKP